MPGESGALDPDGKFPHAGEDGLFVGRVCREKGTEELVRAFVGVHAKVPAARLVIAGSADETGRDRDFVSRLQAICRSDGIEGVVIWAGHRADVREVYRLLGCEPAHAFVVFGDGHSIPDLSRASMLSWMDRWLKYDGDPLGAWDAHPR